MVGRIEDWEGNDACLAFTAMTSVLQQALVPRTFAFGDLTGFAKLFVFIKQIIILGPTQDKASTLHKDLGQPGIACKATIPDM